MEIEIAIINGRLWLAIIKKVTTVEIIGNSVHVCEVIMTRAWRIA